MATKQTRKPRQPKVYADEKALTDKLEALAKKVGNGDYSDAQKTERGHLRSDLGALKFKRLAKQRVGKAMQIIGNVGKLGGAGYTRTEEQVKNISKLLTDAVNVAVANLGTAKKGKETLNIEI
jgi:hypothetical protein